MRRDRTLLLAALAALPLVTIDPVAARASGTTERVSVGPGGKQVDASSLRPSLSASGLSVAFTSAATDLVPGDTNGVWDVFVRGVGGGRARRVSVGPGGRQADGHSGQSAISADGRFVAFVSAATNLVPGDTNGKACAYPPCFDAFVHERATGRTERVSVGPRGRQADGHSGQSAISADGRFVAFVSEAANLVPGDTNGASDVFVRDRRAGTTERVSVATGGGQATGTGYSLEGVAISADGRFVAFASVAGNLVPGDTNGASDVFVRDRRMGRTSRVSGDPHDRRTASGSYAPDLSADGRIVAFVTQVCDDDGDCAGSVLVHDRRTGATEPVPDGSGLPLSDFYSPYPALSADGRYVAFTSSDGGLVPGDRNSRIDVFVRERATGRTERASVATGGAEGNGDSWDRPAISADGRSVAFGSDATDLVPRDTNGARDVFVRRR